MVWYDISSVFRFATSNMQPLGWDWKRPCTGFLGHWWFLKEVQIPPHPKEFYQLFLTRRSASPILIMEGFWTLDQVQRSVSLSIYMLQIWIHLLPSVPACHLLPATNAFLWCLGYRRFPHDIFKCIFLNENVWFFIKISLKFVPKGPINNIPALVQVMYVEYGRVVVVRPPLGTTVPRMTLEIQVSTNVVMPHPDDALLRHDDCLLWRHLRCVPEVGNVACETT